MIINDKQKLLLEVDDISGKSEDNQNAGTRGECGMLPMCKNTPAYDIASGEVLCAELLPGAMLQGMGFTEWAKHRKSVLSNVIARKVYFSAFGQGAEDSAEMQTRILSLSDCYWSKQNGDSITFEQVSPYYADFWKGQGKYTGGAIPTLYTAGAVSKYWLDNQRLYKQGCLIELEACV